VTTAAIVGAAGYTGGELLRLLLGHPHLEVTQITSERLGGRAATSIHPQLRGRTDLRFRPRAELEPADVLLLALGHGESSRALDELASRATTVVDLAADFRLREASDYPRWYGWDHPAPERLGDFVYGLAELHRDQLRSADRVATGGCLATATILGLHPLFAAGVVDLAMPVTVEAKVGSSAAGAQSSPASHHPHRSREMRSFAPTGHRHTAEILQELKLSGVAPGVAFSATAVEAVRGVLVTAHVHLTDDLADRDIWKLYRAAYAAEPFVRIIKEARGIHRYPNPTLLSGTNYCDIGFERDPHSRRVVVMSAIDNLVKGAAGQAVQALNVRHGWDERTGLEFGGLYPL